MKHFITLSILFFPILSGGCATNISGRVVNDQGDPIRAASGKINIQALNASTTPARSYVVDLAPNGEFATDAGLEKGEYLIESLIPGYKNSSIKIDTNERKDVVLQVTPTAKTRTSSIGANVDVELGRGEGGATITPPEL